MCPVKTHTATIGLIPREVPKAAGLPLIGQTLKVLRDPLGLLKELTQQYEEVVRVKLGLKTYYLVQSPAAARHILQENARNYYKPGAAKLMKRILGNGLATSNGALWLKQRKLMQPAFHKSRLSGFFEILMKEALQVANTWKQQEGWQEVDVSQAFLKLTLNNITKAMFGADVEKQMQEISHVLRIMLDFSSDATKSLVKVPLGIPTQKNLAFKRAEQQFEKIIYSFIEQRKEAQKNHPEHSRNDLLDMLLMAYDTSDGAMTTQQLKDEITTIFMAGHETTSQTLSWIFYQLALRPDLYAAVKAEADSLPASGATLEDYQSLQYTRAVIDETMRYYPPVWIMARKSVADDVVCDYILPAGATVLINVYGMHHYPGYWEKPEAFYPPHFLGEQKEQRVPFAYLPFGGGQRLCIGTHFAMMVMQTVIPLLVKEFEFRVPDGFVPTIDPNLTLRAKEGITLLLKHTHGRADS